MNKYCKLILKYLNKHSSKDKPIILDKIYKDINCDKETIEECLDELKRLKLINIQQIMVTYNNSLSAESQLHYWATTLGKEYFSQKFKTNFINLCKHFLTSILCPIVVSIITTLLTIWLFGLFEK